MMTLSKINKHVLFILLTLSALPALFAQDSTLINPQSDSLVVVDTLPITNPADLIDETETEARRKTNVDLSQLALANRSKDHLILQIGYDSWAGAPDSINTKGFARSFNAYFMFDFPFKSNPHLSVAVGAGVSSANMYFSNTYVDISGKNASRLTFTDVSDSSRFKKFKLLTTFIEAPVELRYLRNPQRPKKSLKAALGVKVGTMLGATTKGKTLLNSSGQTINAFTQKEKSKRFFNTTRISVTGRVGVGALAIFGSYQMNAFIKEGFGPDIRPFSVGLSLSGL